MSGKVTSWHIVLAAVTLAVIAFTGRMCASPRAARHGRFSAAEIVRRAELLSRVCVPKAGVVFTKVERCYLWRKHKVVGLIWTVQCVDSHGGDLAYTVWDAETGEAMLVSIQATKAELGGSITRRSALRETGYWLRQLYTRRSDTRWKLDGAAETNGSVWRVPCRSADRRAVITISRSSGDLVTAILTRG